MRSFHGVLNHESFCKCDTVQRKSREPLACCGHATARPLARDKSAMVEATGGRKSIFSGQPCAGSRCYASRKAGVARGRLRRDPQTGRSARRIECGVDVPIGWDEPGQFLAALGAGGAGRGRSGLAGCDPAGRGAASLLWVSPDSGADRAGGFSGRSQEGPAADARR